MRSIGVFHEIGPDLLGLGRHFGNDRPVIDRSLADQIRQSIKADLENQNFSLLAEAYGKRFWRIPNGQFLFWNGLGILFDFENTYSDVGQIELFGQRRSYYEPLIREAGYAIALHPFEESRVRSGRGEFVLRVPFIIAESLMLNVSLCACTEFNLIPFTDDPVHHQFLLNKLKARPTIDASANPSFGYLSGHGLCCRSGERALRIGMPTLVGLTPEKVGELRSRCHDELQRFRSEIMRLIYTAECGVVEEKFDQTVAKIIESQIRPAVEDLRNKLSSLRAKFAVELIDKALTTAPLPLVLNVLGGLPLPAAFAASIGAVWMKQALDYTQRKGELRKSAVTLLLDLQSRVR